MLLYGVRGGGSLSLKWNSAGLPTVSGKYFLTFIRLLFSICQGSFRFPRGGGGGWWGEGWLFPRDFSDQLLKRHFFGSLFGMQVKGEGLVLFKLAL